MLDADPGHTLGPIKAMGTDCWAARHRELVPIHGHHVFPLGHGGPDEPENVVDVCANHHYATHDLLSRMVKAQTASLPWTVRRRYGRKVRRLAAAGYEAIVTRQIVIP